MSVTVVYRRLVDGTGSENFAAFFVRRVSHRQENVSREDGHNNYYATRHKNMGTALPTKKATTQRWLWFNVGFGSFGMWNRHPWMREYATAGALMFQLWKYAERLDHPPDADASAHEVWCALTLVYQTSGGALMAKREARSGGSSLVIY